MLMVSISVTVSDLHFSTVVSRTWLLESFILEYNREQPCVFKFISIFSVLFLRSVSLLRGTSFHSKNPLIL